MWLLAVAVRTLPVVCLRRVDGNRYGRHGGRGYLALGEPATLVRLACIGLIVAGIAGLKMVS